jgi:hypothetical protein
MLMEIIKYSFRPVWMLFVAAGLLFSSPVWAVSMQFIFIAPSSTIDSHFPGGTSGITRWDNPATGYKGVLITPQNLNTFRAVAPDEVQQTYNDLQPGTAFRVKFDEVAQLNGGVTDEVILLVDDSTGLVNNGNGNFAASTLNGKLAVWPAASVESVSGGRYRGVIRLGELASTFFKGKPGEWKAWQGVILHEANHTEFVGEKTKWGTIAITYGGDGTHYKSELLGDQELSWEEGLGNFFANDYNDPIGLQSVNTFWSRTDRRYLIESRSVLAGTSEVWNAPHSEEERPLTTLHNVADRTGRYVWRMYSWWDMPSWYLLFTESTSDGFHMYFARNVNDNRDQAKTMIKTALRDMWQERRKRYLTYEINRLALEMERFAGTSEGQAARASGHLTSSMFPFALLDLLTHFGMTEQKYKQDYDRNYPDRQPLAYTAYWNHRQAVRNRVLPMIQSSPIRMNDAVTALHNYFKQPATILTANP